MRGSKGYFSIDILKISFGIEAEGLNSQILDLRIEIKFRVNVLNEFYI